MDLERLKGTALTVLQVRLNDTTPQRIERHDVYGVTESGFFTDDKNEYLVLAGKSEHDRLIFGFSQPDQTCTVLPMVGGKMTLWTHLNHDTKVAYWEALKGYRPDNHDSTDPKVLRVASRAMELTDIVSGILGSKLAPGEEARINRAIYQNLLDVE